MNYREDEAGELRRELVEAKRAYEDEVATSFLRGKRLIDLSLRNELRLPRAVAINVGIWLTVAFLMQLRETFTRLDAGVNAWSALSVVMTFCIAFCMGGYWARFRARKALNNVDYAIETYKRPAE